MPGVEDWVNCPLDIIQSLFSGSKDEEHNRNIQEYFSKRIQEKNAIKWIPSLNDVPLHNLRTNTLVRMRCMIQDMYDPEFYLGVYEVADVKTGQSRLLSGKYKDIAECRPNETIRMDSEKNVTFDRQLLYCVPIPGETLWVKEAHSSHSQAHTQPSTSYAGNRSKRTLEEDEETSAMETQHPSEKSAEDSMETDCQASSVTDTKKSKVDSKEGSNKNSGPDLNFPLPGEKGPACMVKVYSDSEEFKLNDMVEFIGVLSNDPAMVSFPGEKKGEESAIMDVGMDDVEEQNVHSPPPSLVPRLHAILAHKLTHNNPHLPHSISDDKCQQDIENILNLSAEARQQMLAILTQALLGDRQAAEYLLCHLLSSVYARQDVVAVGKFSLNISGIPKNSEYSSHFYKLLQELVTKCHLISMTLSSMNTNKFIPRKDYQANRLKSGYLQLSDHTHLVLDETAMQPGQLDTAGVQNITALGNIVRWQKVEYDFNYHKQDFITNLPTLVLSEGKSLIQCDSRVHLTPSLSPDSLEEHFAEIHSKLTSSLLVTLRTYLTLARLLPYQLPEDVKKSIEDDFVEMRKEDPKSLTVDDFHGMLVLARLLCLSYGQKVLTRSMWTQAKRMEIQRKQTLSRSQNTIAPSS